jgi:hypothetical protein
MDGNKRKGVLSFVMQASSLLSVQARPRFALGASCSAEATQDKSRGKPLAPQKEVVKELAAEQKLCPPENGRKVLARRMEGTAHVNSAGRRAGTQFPAVTIPSRQREYD